MTKKSDALTALQVKNAKPREKPYKLFDGGGLYLEVAPTGSRIWRLKYRQLNGKENRLSFGPYPEITLQEARERRLEARKLLLNGVDPAVSAGVNPPQYGDVLMVEAQNDEGAGRPLLF